MNQCIQKEESAQQNRLALKALGEELASASDYLTDEVRKYAVTGEIEYLYHYWYEVKVEKRRDNIIEALSAYDLPRHEIALLEEAKYYSDILIETETYAMKLILINDKEQRKEGLDSYYLKQFIEEVLKYPLPSDVAELSVSGQREKGIELLFDENYKAYKSRIMDAIKSFQETMNKRLDREVHTVIVNRTKASMIQIICSTMSLILIFGLLVVIHYFYVYPLVKFTEYLRCVNKREIDLTQLTLVPRGVYELKSFAGIFNNLVETLRCELDMRKKIEKALRSAKEEAEQANQAKSEFLATMSHELRTPLNAMMGYLFLLEQSNLEAKPKGYCEKIDCAMQHLMNLINEVLDFSKIESGSMVFEEVDFDLLQLIDEVQTFMENEISKKGLTLHVEKDAKLPQALCGDVIKLKQVLINLLNNAVKFTDEGAITLQVEFIKKEPKGYYIQFAVRDTGIGIKKKDQQRILEPFVQEDASTTRKYGGTGLGLAICQRIIQEASNGEESLEVSSQLGVGTTFQFVMCFREGILPLVQEQEMRQPVIRGEKQILLVDNNEINLAMESELIKHLGIEVKTASCGEVAIQMVQRYKFDMIFMDIRMPGMDGYETTSKIRVCEGYEKIPIIALSADVVTHAIHKAKVHGMNEYMAKPLRAEKLYALINKYLGEGVFHIKQSKKVAQPIFAVKECLEILNGNEALLMQLVRRFLATQEKTMAKVKASIAQNQFEEAARLLHDLLGLTGNLRCYQLYEITKSLNEAIKNKRAIREEALASWQEVWEATQGELKQYIKGAKGEEKEDSVEESFEEIKSEFILLCEAYDLASVELFHKHSSLFKQYLGERGYRKLQDKMEQYDFEGIVRELIIKGGNEEYV